MPAPAIRHVGMSEHPPPQAAHWPEGAIFTLGHSTLPIERFIALLRAYGIERLADIRTCPVRVTTRNSTTPRWPAR
jgi:hypothetical protein